MSRKVITLTIDSQRDKYSENLKLSREIFNLEYNEISKRYNVGYHSNGDFIVNFKESLFNLIFIKDVNDEVYNHWENKVIKFSKDLSTDSALLQTIDGLNDIQYRLLTN